MAGTNEFVNETLLEEKLLDLWPEHPSLYDVSSPVFKDRNKREESLNEIAEKLGKNGDWVKSKIRTLRNKYTKAKKPPKSGSSCKSSKRVSWLLDEMAFLTPYVASRPTKSNMDEETSFNSGLPTEVDHENLEVVDDDIDIASISETSEHSEPSPHDELTKGKPSKVPRKKQANEEQHLLKALANSINQRVSKASMMDQKDNATLTFGLFVAQSLSELDPITRTHAQHQISNVLFQAKMGMLCMPSQQLPYRTQSFLQQECPPQSMQAGYAAANSALPGWMSSGNENQRDPGTKDAQGTSHMFRQMLQQE